MINAVAGCLDLWRPIDHAALGPSTIITVAHGPAGSRRRGGDLVAAGVASQLGGHQSVHACQQLCVACLPHRAVRAPRSAAPAGWPARPPGRAVYPTCMRMRLWCSISRRAHAPRARTDAIAGRSHVRIAFRSLSPLPPPPPPPYYLTHAGKHGARDLLYYQESDLVPARQFTTPAAFMLVGTRN